MKVAMPETAPEKIGSFLPIICEAHTRFRRFHTRMPAETFYAQLSDRVGTAVLAGNTIGHLVCGTGIGGDLRQQGAGHSRRFTTTRIQPRGGVI